MLSRRSAATLQYIYVVVDLESGAPVSPGSGLTRTDVTPGGESRESWGTRFPRPKERSTQLAPILITAYR